MAINGDNSAYKIMKIMLSSLSMALNMRNEKATVVIIDTIDKKYWIFK